MPSISIPKPFRSGIEALAHLSKEQYAKLFAALRDAKASLFPGGLVSQVAPKLEDLKPGEIRRLIEALIAMYAVRAKMGLPLSEFVQRISNGLDELEDVPLSDEESDGLEQRLNQLLELDNPLGITSKANDVLTEHEHTFCSARIMTDIRPIYQDELTSLPTEAVLIHTLKIAYHQDEEHKEFFVALDTEDIRNLKSAIERAELKAQGARALLGRAEVHYIDAERQP